MINPKHSKFRLEIAQFLKFAIATLDSESDFESCKYQNYNAHIEDALDRIKAYFDKQTGDSCAVCIKLLHSKTLIATGWRDSLSTLKRSQVDKTLPVYCFKDNSGFVDAVSAGCFISNNLQAETYHNANTDFAKHYNACIAVQISLPTTYMPISRNSLKGFLCVDNMMGGFDEAQAEALCHIGTYFACLFEAQESLPEPQRTHNDFISYVLNW